MGTRIGDIAHEVGVSVEAIRYYERLGVIQEASRTTSGYRQFDPEVVRELRFLKRAQQLGFSLDEIRELLRLRLAADAPSTVVLERAEMRLADIEAKIADLERIRDVLRALTRACGGTGSIGDCPILTALEQER